MRRPFRTLVVALAFVCLVDCRNPAPPTPDGGVVGTWKYPNDEATKTGENTATLKLPNGVKLSLTSTFGTTTLEGQTVQLPLSLNVTAAHAGDLEIVANFPNPPLKFRSAPDTSRALDFEVHATRNMSSCSNDPVLQREGTGLRLLPDGTVELLKR